MDNQQPLLDNRYRLVGQVGAGGTAVVYRALDERLGRDVAIKVLRPHLAQDPAYLARFSQEAQRAAQVSHPHIATVLDFNANVAQPYIVMEFVDGAPVGRLAPLPISDAVEFARQSADALGFLHRRQLVHGDVKPDNLLVDRNGRVKLVDLGIARPPGAADVGAVVGSPAYIAPERLQGAPLSPQTDVYGLGAALFEMLTGRPPFSGSTVQAVAAQTLSAEPPALASLRPEIPLAVEGIVARAMAKDPTRRYQDMDTLGRALAGLQMSAGQTTGAMPVLPPTPAPPPRVAAPPPARAAIPPARPPVAPPPAPAQPPAGGASRLPLALMALALALLALAIVGLTLFRQAVQGGRPGVVPTVSVNTIVPPTVAPTERPTQTPTPTRTATATATATATPPPPTATPTPRPPTATPTPRPPTVTPRPATPTAAPPTAILPTATGVPATATLVPATATSVPPTATLPAPTVAPTVAPQGIGVPNVVGMTETEAQAALEVAELKVGVVLSQPAPGQRSGRVLQQTPAAGQTVPRGTAVNLVVVR